MADDLVFPGLYEQDLNAWAVSQAAALRAVRDAIANGQDQPVEVLRTLDWDNLAEEIEGLARRDRRKLASRISVIVEHLAKLEFSHHTVPRAGWIDAVLRERQEVADLLLDSPSLRRKIPGMLARRSGIAIQLAAAALELHGETAEAAGVRRARLGVGYQSDEVLGPGLPSMPPA
jgi:hypothetical protein